MASKPTTLFEKHADRAALVAAIAAAVKASWESRYNDTDDYESLAHAFAEHVADRRLDKLAYLTNGYSEADKQLFSSMTGLKLPKANSAAYKRLRDWCGVPETLDDLNAATASLAALRGSMYSVYPDTFADSEATIMGLIDSGYTEIRKSGGAEYLCSKTESAAYVLSGRAESKTSLYGVYRELIRAVLRAKGAEAKHADFLRSEDEACRASKAADMARRSALAMVRPSARQSVSLPAAHFL